ncbi:MAG: site-specific integrase [Burkholderiales bacterium]|nr:site-specific integrase [Burkholderiales bacterium]
MDRRNGVTPRGKSIQIDFYLDGRRYREALKLPPTRANLEHAKRLKASIQHAIALGKFRYADFFPDSNHARNGSRSSAQTVADALDDFLEASRRTCEHSTWRDYKSAVEYHLKPAFGALLLRDITAAGVKAWLGGLTISNKRINNILIPLRSALGDAFADGLIDRNPVDRVKNLPNRFEEPQPFTPDEVSRILEACAGQGANLFEFAFWTGLRTSELIALEWGDVDWRKGVVHVRRASVRKRTKQTKTAAGERTVMLFPPAVAALQRQKAFTFLAGGRVFNNPRTNEPWETDGQIRKTCWQPALKRAGVVYRNPYQTRHTYASTLLSAGENPLWVAQQMGHKDWGMIRRRYGRWIPEVDASAGGKVMQFWAQFGHKGSVSA